ncbi:hypothetical protein [Marinicella litoralis]|uniref:Uncharacterized protein n=1 Tax=Marinicella litoralis TaxID=644220 RepID=A0A4R6XIZ0_9GAMM|nr:hypothetical protein [Marinicella litoralis]TDR19466.1 hypothetical protein C8D91_2022 [Marinicella litoralis]
MFRKSVSFFILVALFWVLLWVYVPDSSPGIFSIGDVFRGFFLLFSLMSSGFALLMLLIRYKGIDIVSSLFPHGALAVWIGQHAFEYSQPKVMFYCCYQGNDESKVMVLTWAKKSQELVLQNNQPQPLQLGVVTENPSLIWHSQTGIKNEHVINIMPDIKLIGRNLEYDLLMTDNDFVLSRRKV